MLSFDIQEDLNEFEEHLRQSAIIKVKCSGTTTYLSTLKQDIRRQRDHAVTRVLSSNILEERYMKSTSSATIWTTQYDIS